MVLAVAVSTIADNNVKANERVSFFILFKIQLFSKWQRYIFIYYADNKTIQNLPQMLRKQKQRIFNRSKDPSYKS